MRVRVFRSMVSTRNHIDTLYLEASELPRVGDELQLKTSSISNYEGRVSKVIRHFELGQQVRVDVVVIVKRLPRPSPNGAERRSTNGGKRMVKR